MKAALIFTVLLWLSPFSVVSRAEAPGPHSPDPSDIVKLPPFRFIDFFDVNYVLKDGTQNIRYARVGWVGPILAKLGVRTGDFLTGIDGKPVYLMPADKFLASLNLSPKAGEGRTLVFDGKRGLFHKKWHLEATYTQEKDNIPNQAPSS